MSAPSVKAILFDLDGTLVDTARDFVYIIQQLAKQYQLQTPNEEQIREKVSAGALAMVSLFQTIGDTSLAEEQILAYRQQFLDNYEQNICVKSQIYGGLESLLTELEIQGVAWGIVTNKPRYLSERLLQALQLDKRCSVLVCPEDVNHSKPDPEPLYLAIEKLAIDCSEAGKVIYIGDHLRDIEAGNRAGMQTIIAGYGYISAEEKQNLDCWGADEMVETSQELVEQLYQLIENKH